MTLTNRDLSELLARRAEEVEEQKRRAYRRAARSALTWPVEAAELDAQGESLTELRGLGPRLSGLVKSWLEEPPEIPDPNELRADFLTRTEVEDVLGDDQGWRRPRADLQMHTTYSDGKVSVQEMASAGAELGYEFIAITDHSKGLRIAGGIDETEVAAQRDEIDDVNKRFEKEGAGLRVLRSLEMNLDVNGEGDMEDETLASLDFVIGSFHSQLRLTQDQTDRYISALRNRYVNSIGHPRGRRFNHRVGLRADWDRVLAEAASLRKALEINCYPDRQDLNVEILQRAGPDNLFTLGTDAHAPFEMEFMEFGLGAARKAGLNRDQIVNFWPLEHVLEWANPVA